MYVCMYIYVFIMMLNINIQKINNITNYNMHPGSSEFGLVRSHCGSCTL